MEKKEKRQGMQWRIVGVVILIIMLAGGGVYCYEQKLGPWQQTGLEHPQVEDTRSQEQSQSEFDGLTSRIFQSEVTQDSITLNFTLAEPADYGITDMPATLGEYSLGNMQDDVLSSENWLAELETYEYDKLTDEQKLIYDILRVLLQQNLDSADMAEYTESLGPTAGIQAQFPVMLANFSFRKAEDVDTYLQLLKLVPDYFAQIMDFEKKKSADGLFMSDTTAQAIIDQCSDFIASPEDNYLLEVFNNKVNELQGLTDADKKAKQKENKQAVQGSIIPAYQSLIDGLTALIGTGNNKGGLCQLEKGKAYYEYLVHSETGSDRSMDQIDKLLDTSLKESRQQMSQIMNDTPDAYYDAQNVKYPYTEPVESVNYLKQQIGADFPTLPEDIQCEVRYVDESLEDSLSPAFYLTAPIDDYTHNVVYINQNEEYDLSKAFATIAHESYPGHLYQNAYFQSTSPNPLRSLINYGGYTEGWGTYAEFYGYHLAGIDESTADLLEHNTLSTLCLYAKADMGVNYKGWSYKKLHEYLKEYGFSASQTKTIYDSMVAEPATYMQYTLGYLEIRELKQTAEKTLGASFDIKAFHQFLLGIGNAPFSVIRDRMEVWMASYLR